jgi:hypothetical protein
MKLISLILVISAPLFAEVYNVAVDTSSLAPGTAGFIDLAFNGGYPATAAITGYSQTGGSLSPGTIFTQGTVTGSLPGAVTLGDDNADYDEGITFGSSILFQLNLSGTPSGTTGDVFTLSFFNSDFSGSLLTGNINDGWLAQFQMDTNGNITPTAYANPSGGPSDATITTPTPEPGTGMALALALLILMWRTHSRKSNYAEISSYWFNKLGHRRRGFRNL